MTTALELPQWDMTVVYPGLDSVEFEDGFRSMVHGIDALTSLMDDHAVGRQERVTLDDATLQLFDTVTERFNALFARLTTLRAYVHAFVSTDSRDDRAQARMSELQRPLVKLSQLETRFVAWIGSMDVEALIAGSRVAEEHAFILRKARVEAQHLMSPAEEDLAAELNVTGGLAWSKLHDTMTSQIMVPLELDGEMRDRPMTVIRNLAYEPDRDVRRRAYEAEMDAWKGVAVPLCAALNSIKGETNTLVEKRGWQSALAASLFDNNIDRQTLDAMMEGARASFPDFRRYLHVKAYALGTSRLAWYDLFAPLGESTTPWDYAAGREFLLQQFGTYSARLRDFVQRAFRENWIDAEPRPGKIGGAFCMALRDEESRVLTNYMPTYDGVSTLAHELGHAYHNFNLAPRTALQRGTPMTLAETASIFCETIIRHAALERADTSEQIAILEASIQGSCQVVVDISSRFLFESAVLERRSQRELSVDELCELMLETQRETYGDGLDEALLHPYMWAVKGHYYSAHRSFYNYPYMFGLLFGLGLYARYEADPEEFKAGYDELLSSTGLTDAASLAQRFGIDIRTPDFWHSSLDIVRGDIERFAALVGHEGQR